MPRPKTRQRPDGNGNVKTAYIGVRLDPVELDLVDFLSHEPSLCKDGKPLSKSDVIRFLLKAYVRQAFTGTGVMPEQVEQYLAAQKQRRVIA